MRIRKYIPHDITELSDTDNVWINMGDCEFEEKGYEPDSIRINGFAIIHGKATELIEINVLLKDEQTGEYWELPTEIVPRPDVTECVNDGVNYDYSGFSVDFSSSKMNFESHDYSVYLLYSANNETYLLDCEMSI